MQSWSRAPSRRLGIRHLHDGSETWEVAETWLYYDLYYTHTSDLQATDWLATHTMANDVVYADFYAAARSQRFLLAPFRSSAAFSRATSAETGSCLKTSTTSRAASHMIASMVKLCFIGSQRHS